MARVEGYSNPTVDIVTAEHADPDWLVPDIFLRGTVVCYAGEAASGKSFVMYTIGLALASGSPALSGLVPAGPPRTVLYFDEENAKAERDKYIQRAFRGLTVQNRREPDLASLDARFFPVNKWLSRHADWYPHACEFVDAYQPALIVFDTSTPAFGIRDENSNGEASPHITKLGQLVERVSPAAVAVVLRHANTDKVRGRHQMRGAKTWVSQTDATMFQVRAAGRPRPDGLHVTRLEKDKSRAFGLARTIYITPRYTDARRSGLILEGSYEPTAEHRKKLREEEETPDAVATGTDGPGA